MIIRTALFSLHVIFSHLSADSARMEAGRLIVEPVGVSFQIPPAWLDSNIPRLGGVGCDPHSASARAVNTDAASLRSMTGISPYFGDQYFSALADSVFPVSNLVAHLGSRGWRECDNTVGDLQMRVYVGARMPAQISQRLRSTRVSAYPGYSVPAVEVPQDSVGWHIERVTWTFNCGDCISFEFFEIYSKRFADRTVSLVFMYSPVVETLPQLAPQADKRGILRSIAFP